MALAITVNGAGTFTASMEEGPVSFSASLGAIGPGGPGGPGVAAGGTTGQILVKTTNADYATGWIDNAARTVFVTARNNTGSTIAKGAVVYLSGATGNKATIALAQATSEATSARTIGITKAEIANNADGDVIISGAIENLDTSAFAAGQVVYLSASVAGGLQTTLPTQPNHGVVLGIITRSHPSLGSIEVTVQNYQELRELSDVLITSPTNGQALIYETSSGLWKNASANPFDQSLNTTDNVSFVNVRASNGVSVNDGGPTSLINAGSAWFYSGANVMIIDENGLTFPDTTTQTTAYPGPPDLSAYLTKADNLASVASASTARTNLGLGTMATETATDYLTKASNLSDLASTSTARTNLGLGTMATETASDYAKVGTTNTFSASQVISVTDNSNAALRVTQLGTGEAFRVEDSTNPDSTPFVIDATGKVGIGGGVDASYPLRVVGGSGTGGIRTNGFCLIDGTSSGVPRLTVTQSGNGGGVVVNNAGTGASFRVNDETSDTTPFIVDAGGNVGVKTASPSTDFEVNGNAKVTTLTIGTSGAISSIAQNATDPGIVATQTYTQEIHINIGGTVYKLPARV